MNHLSSPLIYHFELLNLYFFNFNDLCRRIDNKSLLEQTCQVIGNQLTKKESLCLMFYGRLAPLSNYNFMT